MVSQSDLDELLEISYSDFLNKVVKLTAKNISDDFSPDYPMTGRIVKLHKNGKEALIVNKECLSSEDMMRPDGPFKRGSWFTLDKYEMEITDEC